MYLLKYWFWIIYNQNKLGTAALNTVMLCIQYVCDSHVSLWKCKKRAEKKAIFSENVQIKIRLDV